MSNEFIFKTKTKEGYTIKVLIELLQNCLKEGCFIINNNGIFLTGMDSKSSCGTKLACLSLHKENFISYKLYNTNEIQIGLNMIHFYKMLKSIKKKDTINIFIRKDNDFNLGITIQQPGDNIGLTSYVKITKIQPVNVELPDEYTDNVSCSSKSFQKLKTLNKISKDMKITFYNNKIDFFCDKEGIFSRLVTFSDDEENENEDREEKDEEDTYTQTYETDQIIQLVKVGNLSNIIKIFYGRELPLKFKFNIGTLGDLSIFFKSKEQLKEEDSSAVPSQVENYSENRDEELDIPIDE